MAVSNLPDFSKYDDEKLEAARTELLTEIETRARRSAIPGQIQTLAAAYVADGGELGDLSLEAPAAPSAGSGE